MFFGDFPVVAAGNYIVQIRERAGASPDTDDAIISQGQMVWDGTAEVLPSDITADIAALEAKVDIIDTNVDTANTNIDYVLTAQRMVRIVETDPDEITQVVTLKGL
jgi:MinD-like ATPase involved in chromosome partitioning or flagellar assembly